jgi:2-oxo-4-hydroxy-4-carboxy-5-ureidoimidazoline decarboxylase
MSPVALSTLNQAPLEGFLSVCGPVFEHSPWIAERTWPRRPFASVQALREALLSTVENASAEEKLGLIRSHPDLVDRLAREAGLGVLSAGEQAAAGLNELSTEEAQQFRSFNRSYRERFGFPFVICARENRKDAILHAFPERLRNSREQEIAAALSEIGKIAWLRLRDAVAED